MSDSLICGGFHCVLCVFYVCFMCGMGQKGGWDSITTNPMVVWCVCGVVVPTTLPPPSSVSPRRCGTQCSICSSLFFARVFFLSSSLFLSRAFTLHNRHINTYSIPTLFPRNTDKSFILYRKPPKQKRKEFPLFSFRRFHFSPPLTDTKSLSTFFCIAFIVFLPFFFFVSFCSSLCVSRFALHRFAHGSIFSTVMGIDLKARHKRKGARTEQKSADPYLALLVKLYRFLARRTGSSFNETVLKRLYMSRTSRAPVSTSRLAQELKGKTDKVIAVVVGTITHDPRLAVVPKMSVCALRVSRQVGWHLKVFLFSLSLVLTLPPTHRLVRPSSRLAVPSFVSINWLCSAPVARTHCCLEALARLVWLTSTLAPLEHPAARLNLS